MCAHTSTHNRVGQAMDLQSYIGSNTVEVYVQGDGLVCRWGKEEHVMIPWLVPRGLCPGVSVLLSEDPRDPPV